MADDVQLNATAPSAPDVSQDTGMYGPAVPAATVTPESHPIQVQFPSGHTLAFPKNTPTATVSAASEDFWDRVKDAVPVLKGEWIKHPMAPEDAGQLVYPERANTPVEQQEHPIMTGVGEFAGSLTSPGNILTMLGMGPLGEVAPLASKVMAGAFSASMLHNAMQQTPAAMAAYKRGDVAEAQRLATHALLSTLMAGGIATGVAADEGRPAPGFTSEMEEGSTVPQESTPNQTMSRDPNLAALEANRRGAAEEMARKYPVKAVGLLGAEQAAVAPKSTTVGSADAAARDTELFQQAREQLGPNASLSEVAQKAQELKTNAPVAVNASGESAASQEAINRLQSQKTQGVKTYRVDTRSGNAVPVLGVDAVDATAKPFEKIVQVKGNEVTEMDSGRGARPLDETKLLQQVTPSTTSRIAQRAKSMAADESGEATVPFTGTQQGLPGLGREEAGQDTEGEDTRPNVPTFFSKVGKIVDEKMQGKAGAGNQILATLKNNGAKDDEIKWMGLDDFLKDKPKVSKAELQDYIKNNQIQIQPVNRGEGAEAADQMRIDKDHLHDYLTRVKDGEPDSPLSKALGEWFEGEGPESTKKLLSHPDMTPELASHISQYDQFENALEGAPTAKPKYSKYVLDGPKENYNEKLLTLPVKNPPVLQNEAQQAFESFRDQMGEKYGKDPDNGYGIKAENLDEAEITHLRELLDSSQREEAGNRRAKKESGYNGPHFEEQNILAHVRHDDRIDTDGKKNLFLEEVQSDWHQSGKQEGYRISAESKKELASKVDAANDAYQRATKAWNETDTDEAGKADLRQKMSLAYDAQRNAEKAYNESVTGRGVPEAPFKNDWHELALKSMLREAAEKGYDRMSWTTGEQQQNRYDLSHEISKVEYDPSDGRLKAYDHRGNETVDESVDGDEESLAKYIGAGPAAKLAKQIRDYEPASEEEFPYDSEYDYYSGQYSVEKRGEENEEDLPVTAEREAFNKFQADLLKKYGQDPNSLHPDMEKRPEGWSDQVAKASDKLTPEEKAKGLELKRAAERAEKEQEDDNNPRYYVIDDSGHVVGETDGHENESRAEREMHSIIESDVDSARENWEPESTGSEELPYIDGLDLKTGGEWAEALYDRAIPNFLNKYLKKWGGKVSTGFIPIEEGGGIGGQLPYELYSPSGRLYDAFRTQQQARDALKSMEGASEGTGWTIKDKSPNDEKVHSIDITPAMRKVFMKEGQPIAKVTPPPSPAQPDTRKQRVMQNLTEALA